MVGLLIVILTELVYQIAAQGYISLNARALSDTQVLISRYNVGNVELAYLDFSYRPEGDTRWRTTRYNPTREYFPFTSLNKSSFYYFRLVGRQTRTYNIIHSYTHIRTPPYKQRAPRNVTATTRDDNSVLVRWLPEPDGRILGYLVIYTEVDSKDRSLTEYKVKPVFRQYQTILADIKGSSRYIVEVASISLDGEGASRQSVFIGEQQEPYLRMSIPPRNIKVRNDGTIILSCKVEGFPSPTITWRKSGRRLDDRKHRFLEEQSEGVSILRIDPVMARKDGGTYNCVATNGMGRTEKAQAVVKTYKPRERPEGYPSIREHPILKYVEEGSNVVMTCTSEGAPEITTRWYRNSFPVYYSANNRVSLGASGQLVIANIRKSDQGTYECSAENDIGVEFSFPAHIYVRERVKRTTPPTFLRNRLLQKVDYGKEATLTCDAVGDPIPVVRWEKAGTRLDALSHNGQTVLVVYNMTESTDYTCIASNSLDTITRAYKVLVTQPRVTPQFPIFKPAILHVSSKFRGAVTLVCEAYGNPLPKLVWTLGVNIVKRKSVNGRSELILRRLRRSGNYTCIATNNVGQNTQVYEVAVAKRSGLADRPIRLNATSIKARRISIKWEAPKNATGVTGFVVYADDKSMVGRMREVVPLVYQHTVYNLAPDTLYHVRVASIAGHIEGLSTAFKPYRTTKRIRKDNLPKRLPA